MEKIKLLLCCTKQKPYLYREDDDTFKLENKQLNEDTNEYKKYYGLNNGKIVAECDFEVEEIIKNELISPRIILDVIQTKLLQPIDLSRKSCLSSEELKSYNPNFAIHIKNLNIFDKPRELSEFAYKPKNGYWKECWLQLDRVNNMKYCYEKHPVNNTVTDKQYIVISVKPEEMCRILNKEQNILIRKRVLKELI